MTELIRGLLSNQLLLTITDRFFTEYMRLLKGINWGTIIKVSLFNLAAVVLGILLFLANDRSYTYFNNRRTRKHRLTIRNRGNVPSVFLLRTIELPKQLTVRFRTDKSSMIMVTQRPKEQPKPETEETVQQEVRDEPSAWKKDTGSSQSLIPDLNKPLEPGKEIGKAAEKTVKTVGKTGKKFGLFAGILGTISSLLPTRVKGLNEAQDALKGVQQTSNEVVGSINQKTGSIGTLKNQVGSLVPDSLKDKASGIAQDAAAGLQQEIVPSVTDEDGSGFVGSDYQQSLGMKDFIYDEDVWRKNIGKTDENDGSLVYAQSKVLNPGESMQVSVEIMNLSESNAPISFMYKIEVLQIPQTKLPLAAPRQYISGVVSYQKISRTTRILPIGIAIGMIIIAFQILAGISYLLF